MNQTTTQNTDESVCEAECATSRCCEVCGGVEGENRVVPTEGGAHYRVCAACQAEEDRIVEYAAEEAR